MPHIGTTATKRLSTGKLLYKAAGTTYEIDFGNIISWKRNNKTERVTHMTSQKGFKIDDFELTKAVGFGYTFVCSEFSDDAIALIQKGTKGTAVEQTLASGGSASFNGVLKGATYNLGKKDVSAVVVTVSAAEKVLDTDYSLDAATGRITIIPSGSIADGANVSVAFDCAALFLDVYSSADSIRGSGTFTFFEYDQQSTTILAEHTWTGSFYVNDAGDNNTDAFTQFTIESKCHTPPVIKQRQ